MEEFGASSVVLRGCKERPPKFGVDTQSRTSLAKAGVRVGSRNRTAWKVNSKK